MSTAGGWPAEAASVPQARRLVREHLQEQGQTELLDTAELLVTELVANVVLHVGGTVEVRAVSRPGEVVLEVTDSSRVVPQARSFSATSTTGRGLRLVHALATEHGVRTRPDGKTVWVRLTTLEQARSDEDLLEQFSQVDWLAALDDDAPGDPAPGGGPVLRHPGRPPAVPPQDAHRARPGSRRG